MTDERQRWLADRYSGTAQAYRRHWAPVLLTASGRLLERLPVEGVRRVLDLGTGVGALLPEIRKRTTDALVVGVDRAEGMIRMAPAEFPRAVMDAANLGFRDESFDAVVMAFVLFHLPEPAAGLAEINRVLRPGGAAAIATWAGDPQDSPATRLWSEELDRAGAITEDPFPPRHDLMDTPEKLAALMTEAGLIGFETEVLPLDDRMDLEEFLTRRTTLGFSQLRFASLPEEEQPLCVQRARSRLERLDPKDLTASEVAILAWGKKAG